MALRATASLNLVHEYCDAFVYLLALVCMDVRSDFGMNFPHLHLSVECVSAYFVMLLSGLTVLARDNRAAALSLRQRCRDSSRARYQRDQADNVLVLF